MTTLLSMGEDIRGKITYGTRFSDVGAAVTLAQGVAQTLITVPSDQQVWEAHFNFQAGSSVWVARNSTATFPTGTPASTVSEQNPGPRTVYAGDTISVITRDLSADVGVMLFATNE